jgi:hypothetical protein
VTDIGLAAVRARHAAYLKSHDHSAAFACCTAHASADDVPALLANQLPEGGTWTTESRHRNTPDGEWVTDWQDFQPEIAAEECVAYGCEQRRTYRWTGPVEPIAAPSSGGGDRG